LKGDWKLWDIKGFYFFFFFGDLILFGNILFMDIESWLQLRGYEVNGRLSNVQIVLS